MRPIAPAMRALMAGRNWRARSKVWIENPDGVMQDVTAFLGANWLDTATWTEHADQPVTSGTITLLREDFDLGVSLAPAIGASLANRNAAAEYAPFLQEGRAFQITHAVVAPGVATVPGDYFEVMRGYIDTVRQSHDQNEVLLDFRDPGAALLDADVMEETTYADNDAGMPLEDVIQAVLDDNMGVGTVVLYTPVSPATIVRNQLVPVGKVFERIRDLALANSGWDLRYKYDAAGVMRLTFYEPRRAFDPDVDAPDTLFAKNEYTAIPRLDIGVADVRNQIRVGYLDVATGQREHIDAVDAVSIAKYRKRFMELNFGNENNINTPEEAQAIADAALSDLSTPYSDHDATTAPFYWPAQIGDVYEFEANDIVYDSNQMFGVVGYTHVLAADGGETTFVTKGKVVGAIKEWKRRARVILGPDDGEDVGDDMLRVRNFREIRRTPTAVTYGWTPDARAIEQWLWAYTYDQPVTADPWPTKGSPNPIRLTPETAEYTFPIPATGKITYALLLPLGPDYDANNSDGQQLTIHPLDAVPTFDNFSHAPGADGNFRDAAFTVLDPGGIGGELRVWVAKASAADASPGGIPDGTYAVPLTPCAVGPGTSFVLAGGGAGNLLDEIRVHPGRGKRIYAEFVNALGISSGITSFVLLSAGGPVDSAGDLVSGIVKLATQFASTIKPVSIYSGLPVTGYVGEVALNLSDTPPKLYRWTGTAWTAATPTTDLSGQINTAQIADAAVNAQKIADAAVERVKIALGAIDVQRIADGAVETAKIAALAVTNALIAVNAITSTKISDDAVTTPKIFAGAITTAKIAAGAVTAVEIAALTIVAGNIAAGAVTAAKIAAHTITANEILAGTISALEIAAATITGAKIAANTITAGNIQALTITAAELAAGSISTAKIQANAITSNELAADSVVAGKIAAAAIATAALQAGAVTSLKINVTVLSAIAADIGTITAGKLQNAGGTQYLDLNASGTNGFLVHPKLTLRANGNAEFTGDVILALSVSSILFRDGSGNTVASITTYYSGGVGNGVIISAYQLGGGGTPMDFLFFKDFALFQNGAHNALLVVDRLRIHDGALDYDVKVGAANSGGAGFRMLRIDN